MRSASLNRITVGIVGCGVGSKHHLRALRVVPDIEVLWFCDKDENRAYKMAQQSGSDSLVNADFNKLLNNHTPDVVHIITPPATHATLAIQAMEKGCHIMLDKPMATTVEDAQQILEIRNRTGTRLCMMHNHMFDPTIIKAHEIVRRGFLGEVICVEGRHFYEYRKMEVEGLHSPEHWVHTLKSGTAGEFMPHTVYLLQSFAGSCNRLQLIHGTNSSHSQTTYSIHSWMVQLKCEAAVARVFVTDNMPYGHFGIDIYGSEAALHINMMDLTYSIERIRDFLPLTAARMASTLEQSMQKVWQTIGNSVRIAAGRLKRRPGHLGLMRAFYSALRRDDPMPVNGEDGLEVVRTMEMLDFAVADYTYLKADKSAKSAAV